MEGIISDDFVNLIIVMMVWGKICHFFYLAKQIKIKLLEDIYN